MHATYLPRSQLTSSLLFFSVVSLRQKLYGRNNQPPPSHPLFLTKFFNEEYWASKSAVDERWQSYHAAAEWAKHYTKQILAQRQDAFFVNMAVGLAPNA